MWFDVHLKDWQSETFTRNTKSHFGKRCLRRAFIWNFSVDWLAIAWLQCAVGKLQIFTDIYRSDFVQKSPVLPGCNWNAIVGCVPSAFGGNWGSLSCWCSPYSGLVIHWLEELQHWLWSPLRYSTCFGWKPLRQSRKWRPKPCDQGIEHRCWNMMK